MVTKPDSDTADPVLAAFDEKERQALADLARVRRARAAYVGDVSIAGGEKQVTNSAVVIPDGGGGPFHGLGLAEAAIKHLAECNRQPQTVRQIWAVLHRNGFKILAEQPEATLSWQLRKREGKQGDVVLTGNGLWGLTEWYTPQLVRSFRESRNVASGRNHDEHVARTTAGIANAKERGVTWGRRSKITSEMMAKVKRALQAGASTLEAADSVGLSYQTIHLLRKQGIIDRWEIGTPWPPAEARNYALTNGHKKSNGHDAEDADDARPAH